MLVDRKIGLAAHRSVLCNGLYLVAVNGVAEIRYGTGHDDEREPVATG